MRHSHPPELLPVGPYKLLAPVGRGSGGAVYRALDTRSQEIVALKLLARELAEHRVHRARFRREVWFLSTHRDHPNILRIVDMGEHDGQPYFATEYIDGGSIQQQLRAGYRPTRVECVDIALQVLEALHQLHRHHVVHRDVKLANILRRRDGRVVLGDFGIARHDRLSSITLHGEPIGTPAYSAPEQRGDPHAAGPCADLFSVAAVLYRLVTRQRPPELAMSEFNPSMLDVVPESMRPVVARATRYLPDHRYESARAMAEDLTVLRERLRREPEPSLADGPSVLEMLEAEITL